ncbi:MAG: hypothetical protein DBX47_07190 [Clostridiales bacterium]|nr:MAG: hypothetical protein DBX47_07190 [Clostridiales bacterium]
MSEQKRYFKTVNIIFALGLIPLFTQYIIQIPYSLLKSSFTDFFEQNKFWTDFFLVNIIYILLYTSSILFLASFVFRKKPNKYFKSKKVCAFDKTAYVFIFLGSAMVLSFVWNLFQMFITAVTGKDVIGDYTQMLTIPQGFGQTVAYFFLVALLPAICEELVMRSVICGTLAEYNDKAAMFISALIFALFHYTIAQAPYAFALGLLFAFIYIKTRSFFIVLLLHFLNNLISAFFTVLTGHIDDFIITEMYIFTAFCAICGGICFLMLYIKKHKKDFKRNQLITGKEALKYSLMSPMLWITVVISVAYTLFINSLLL